MTMDPRFVVLYARSDALGDAVMRIPALRAARHAFPAAHIVYATQGPTTLAAMLRRQVAGVVDEVRPHTALPTLLAELGPAWGEAAVADFRTVVGWLVLERLRLLPRGVVYEANFPGYLVSSPGAGWGMRPEHNAWRYHRLIERLARRPLPFNHRLTATEPGREQARRVRGDGYRPLVLLGGNAAAHKALTAAQLEPVASALLERGYDVVYLHTPGDGPTGAELAARVPSLSCVGPGPNVAGVPLLDVCLGLGEAAVAFVGPEGGLGHCMAGLGTALVLVNHGANIQRWRPLTGEVETVQARTASPTGRSADVPPATILQAFDRLTAAREQAHAQQPVWAVAKETAPVVSD
jgi:ADP-heptose:LPS heptosyltransferase